MRKKVLLTPELAQKLLDCNYQFNRKVRQLSVQKIMSDIKEGRWNPDVSAYQDPILVSKSGYLLNGQHRCLAVIRTGISVYVWIEYDVPERTYDYLDGGTPRRASDFIGDIPNPNNTAALAKIMFCIKYGDAPLASSLQGKIKPGKPDVNATRQQIIEYARENQDDILRYINLGARASQYLGKKKNQISTALYIIDYVGNGDQLERFVEECSLLVPESQQVVALRSYMCTQLSNRSFIPDRKWIISCIFTAYDAFYVNREVKQFNKHQFLFSRYDKLIAEQRKKERG